MAAVLDKEIKRELVIAGKPYTVTISPIGVKIASKGHRKGRQITWTDLVGGDVELTLQLEKSLSARGNEGPTPDAPPRNRRSR